MHSVTKLIIPLQKIYRVDVVDKFGNKLPEKKIQGRQISVFVRDNIVNNEYHFSQINVYADGKIDVHCGEFVNIEGLKALLKSGQVKTQLPENVQVKIYPFGTFSITNVKSFVREEEFLKEVIDMIEELNNRLTSGQKCIALFREYEKTKSEDLRKKLKEIYYQVPEYKRQFLLGDMDGKDEVIKKAIHPAGAGVGGNE
ncbi:hypothetical protein HZA38_02975 [Candidatus Peregrinibacteria bacterium]|nr:hypothetical protein [Candidatus Peregrinibacteria bacterium]